MPWLWQEVGLQGDKEEELVCSKALCGKGSRGSFEFLNFKEEELFPELNNGCEGRGPERRKGWDHSCGWMLRNPMFIGVSEVDLRKGKFHTQVLFSFTTSLLPREYTCFGFHLWAHCSRTTWGVL